MNSQELKKIIQQYLSTGKIDSEVVNWLYNHYLTSAFILCLRKAGASQSQIARAYELIEG
jgi:hypothetical protein